MPAHPATTSEFKQFEFFDLTGLYFVDALKEPAVLKFVDLASRKVTVLATLPKPPAKFTRSLSISPERSYALYCEDDVDRYEIRVVENFR